MRVLIPKALIPKSRLHIRKTELPLAHTTLVATIWACFGTSIRISAVTARSYDSQRLSCSLGPPHMYCDPSGTLHTPLPPTERRCTGDLCAFETKSQNRWGDLSSLKRARYLSRTRPMDQNCTGEVPESTGSTHIAETGR